MDISEYKLIKNLGHGHNSQVLLMENKNTQKLIALKAIKLKNDLVPTSIKNEIEILHILATDCNKYVVCFIHSFKSKDYYYIATEYIEDSKTLSKFLLTRNPLCKQSFEEYEYFANTVFPQLIDGLHFIHNKNIVHRDIKDDNILITDTFQIKYIDFGFSNTKKHIENYIVPRVVGSVNYMDPLLLSKKQITFEKLITCDFYSLDCVFSKIITSKTLNHIFYNYCKNHVKGLDKIVPSEYLDDDDIEELIHEEDSPKLLRKLLLFFDLNNYKNVVEDYQTLFDTINEYNKYNTINFELKITADRE